jgi:hypothetical protein
MALELSLWSDDHKNPILHKPVPKKHCYWNYVNYCSSSSNLVWDHYDSNIYLDQVSRLNFDLLKLPSLPKFRGVIYNIQVTCHNDYWLLPKNHMSWLLGHCPAPIMKTSGRWAKSSVSFSLAWQEFVSVLGTGWFQN